eukprot:CAMPEP_0115005784 /NCGR_PEP_ID=MMETSP0216-20121206/20094_1 /TAXON_ID=223996 /ORGANISM="Protocruzia adherens, Strain Boccale" /LENGTH=209 /DNA_ID=CAMNT_0002372209 /DNA_START=18 /DNA_END=647 /DNA_ORIENTATION=+
MDHNHAHGPGKCTCHAEHKESDPNGLDLYHFINRDKAFCLNEDVQGSCQSVFKPPEEKTDKTRILASDEDDPELLLHLEFSQTVKVKAINIATVDEESAPTSVRIFLNRDDLDFGTANDGTPAQEIQLIHNPLAEVDYPTKITKFQNVDSLFLHFPNSNGELQSKISYIGFKGENTSVRKGIVIATYESKPLASDHKNPIEESMGKQID